jgi:hypothetical protein
MSRTPDAEKVASRSLTEKPTSAPPSSFAPVSFAPGRRRCSSVRARAGIRIWSVPSGSGPVSVRSRSARRYESVATNLVPEPSAATSTPVRSGRASSFDAARTTCRRASDNAAAGSVTWSGRGSGRTGKSSTAKVRTTNFERAAEISTSSSPPSNVTAPGSSDRTMSTARRAGVTNAPSSRPITSTSTRTVRSRSVPTTVSPFPATSTRTPVRAAAVEPRLVTARPAVASASTSVSRSQRNFTQVPFSLKNSILVVTVVGVVDCG